MTNRPKGLAVLCAAIALVGAHHSEDHSLEPEGPAAVPLAPSLLVGSMERYAGASAWSSSESFRLVPAEGFGRIAALDSAQLTTVLKLNRIDEKHARRRLLIVPDSIADELTYAPFPATLPQLDSVSKLITVSRRLQAFGAYEYGRLVRWGPSSTGRKETPTEEGLFFTNWKSRETISTDDSTWVLKWYFNIASGKGVAFHEYDLPGRPASHGCVRLLEADARWIFDWAEQWEVPSRKIVRKPLAYGTPVVIMGEYDYTGRAPWMELAENPRAAQVSAEEMDSVLAGHLPRILERVRQRRSLALR